MDIRGLAQTILDNALASDGVYSYWLRKTETTGEDPDEYVVYTLDSDPADAYADNEPLVRNANVAVRYYHRDSMLDTHTGRETIKAREIIIATALEQGGFSLPNGWFDAGDIDDIGFAATVFEGYYGRVV